MCDGCHSLFPSVRHQQKYFLYYFLTVLSQSERRYTFVLLHINRYVRVTIQLNKEEYIFCVCHMYSIEIAVNVEFSEYKALTTSFLPIKVQLIFESTYFMRRQKVKFLNVLRNSRLVDYLFGQSAFVLISWTCVRFPGGTEKKTFSVLSHPSISQ